MKKSNIRQRRTSQMKTNSDETGNLSEQNAAGNENTERREALVKMGKLAAYAAPFTVLALTNKAKAATGHGPGRH
jgi:hypothetical protein